MDAHPGPVNLNDALGQKALSMLFFLIKADQDLVTMRNTLSLSFLLMASFFSDAAGLFR